MAGSDQKAGAKTPEGPVWTFDAVLEGHVTYLPGNDAHPGVPSADDWLNAVHTAGPLVHKGKGKSEEWRIRLHRWRPGRDEEFFPADWHIWREDGNLYWEQCAGWEAAARDFAGHLPPPPTEQFVSKDRPAGKAR